MQKNQIVLAVIIVVVVGGIIWWAATQERPSSEQEQKQELTEVFSMTGIVESVDAENNSFQMTPSNQEGQIKVVISETTQLIKLEFPFDPANPPAEATFTPIQTEIEISGFSEGDNVFIKAKENIAGQTEVGNIDFIHVLP